MEFTFLFVSPLLCASSFPPVKRTKIGRNLLDHAHELCGLLPAFCRYPTDLYRNVEPLKEVLIKFLKKKDPLMHENVAVALQVMYVLSW